MDSSLTATDSSWRSGSVYSSMHSERGAETSVRSSGRTGSVYSTVHSEREGEAVPKEREYSHSSHSSACSDSDSDSDSEDSEYTLDTEARGREGLLRASVGPGKASIQLDPLETSSHSIHSIHSMPASPPLGSLSPTSPPPFGMGSMRGGERDRGRERERDGMGGRRKSLSSHVGLDQMRMGLHSPE
ncbi:hypothetical protein KIPB_013449, partial [Kipferlia bialata]|eukprot:g13449.t1